MFIHGLDVSEKCEIQELNLPPCELSNIPDGEIIPSRDTLIEKLATYMELFSACTVYVTNFPGLNIPNLKQSVVLLRYLSLSFQCLQENGFKLPLYPVEWLKILSMFGQDEFISFIRPLHQNIAEYKQTCQVHLYLYRPTYQVIKKRALL